MKVKVFIRGDAPEMREAQEFADKVKESGNVEVEVFDTEEREGKEVAEVYDVYAAPSFLVTTDEGVVMGSWLGKIPAEFELKEAVNL